MFGKKLRKKDIIKRGAEFSRDKKDDRWLADKLDRVTDDDIMALSSVRSGIQMDQSISERLAWSVIDKAELVDDEEIKRREYYKKRERRKYIIHGCVALVIVAIIIGGLAYAGVFNAGKNESYAFKVIDYKDTQDSKWASESGNASSIDGSENEQGIIVTDFHEIDNYKKYIDSSQKIDTNEKTLSNTIYNMISDYCETNKLVIGEYKVVNKECMYNEESGEYQLLCEVDLCCYSINESFEYDNSEDAAMAYDYPAFKVLVDVE